MSSRFIRTVAAVLMAVSIGLVCLPACTKTKSTEPDSTPAPGPGPDSGPAPGPGVGSGRDPFAPSSPVFRIDNAATRKASADNLKQIGLAFSAFHDAHGQLPGGYADKTGKPGLSWRVAILPYIEQNNLFRQFKLDEPWDSEHNKKLIQHMPKEFAPPRTITNYTFLRGFTGPGTWLEQPKGVKLQPGQPIRAARLVNFTDGSTNTIVVAEAYDPVIWTKPDELEFSPKNLPKLGGVYDGGMHVLFADGHVRYLRKGIDPTTLAKLIQMNDGLVIDFDKLDR